jgi:hypothetical protein
VLAGHPSNCKVTEPEQISPPSAKKQAKPKQASKTLWVSCFPALDGDVDKQ